MKTTSRLRWTRLGLIAACSLGAALGLAAGYLALPAPPPPVTAPCELGLCHLPAHP